MIGDVVGQENRSAVDGCAAAEVVAAAQKQCAGTVFDQLRRAAQHAAANGVIQNGIGDEHLRGLDRAGNGDAAVGGGVIENHGVEIIEFVRRAAVEPVRGAACPTRCRWLPTRRAWPGLANHIQQHAAGRGRRIK